MKSHVWRPLYVVLVIIAAVLVTRKILVPADFGIGTRGYMYGWHRPSNEQQWKDVKVKYRTSEYCKTCHQDKYDEIKSSPHGNINCENCHGPALGHPDDPKSLTIDRNRELCARCHFRLEYPTSGRGKIRGINPKTHHPELECVTCHWPHDPRKAGHGGGTAGSGPQAGAGAQDGGALRNEGQGRAGANPEPAAAADNGGIGRGKEGRS